ncbi:MAG: hypothetical protein WKG07_31970 [Hymenobacter sp.]
MSLIIAAVEIGAQLAQALQASADAAGRRVLEDGIPHIYMLRAWIQGAG